MPVVISYFVHGTTTDNERGLATGWRPGVLAPVARDQAARLRRLVENEFFDGVFSSDLARAIEFARMVFGQKHDIVDDARLREVDYGGFTGRPIGLFEHRLYHYVDNPFPGGESYRDVEARVRDFLDFLRREYGNARVAVVAHQGPQLALEVLLNGKTWRQAIDGDWRKRGAWQPWWDYVLE